MSDSADKFIRVKNAREHNLKGINVDIPRDRLVVVTGLSGSGKSSLAFDTIFAEGQRKYMESLSSYARQFLEQMQKPDVEEIEGLPPTIAIEQRHGGHNPRSTVATTTEIYDYLRLLFARCGFPTCWEPVKRKRGGAISRRCGKPISAQSASQIVEDVLNMSVGSKLMILSPVIRGKKGYHKEVLESLNRQGFVRARVNGKIIDLRDVLKEDNDNPLDLARYERQTIEAVVDRVVLKKDSRSRLAESIELALKISDGLVVVSSYKDDEWSDHLYSEKHACALHPHCAIEDLAPRLFSFNSPYGACSACDGLGIVTRFDESLILPDDSLSLKKGAIAPWANSRPGPRAWFARRRRKFCRSFAIREGQPVKEYPAALRRILLYGTTVEDEELLGKKWDGVIPELQNLWGRMKSNSVRDWLSQYMDQSLCSECAGDRLRIESLCVFLRSSEKLPDECIVNHSKHGLDPDPFLFNIADFTHLTITQAENIINAVELDEEQSQIASPVLREIKARLGFMSSVGLEYLTLDRRVSTLSGGEAQRIRLATQVGSGLVGVCYVLDEPTIGLHQRDNNRLIKTLRHLADIGNTVLVVEHDEEMIRSADHVIDLGPGPGVHGGEIVAQGKINEILSNKNSLTSRFLSGTLRIDVPKKRRQINTKSPIKVKGASQNNLKQIDVEFPIGGIVCVTGVSGSGKSTLVNEILLKGIKKHLNGSPRIKPGAHRRITGLSKIGRVIEVDQSPIGRTPRSNPATYTGLFDDVRKIFTKTREARVRGYKPGRFSFNVKGGRCEACQGQGVKKIEMHFLPDVFVQCEVCRGARYNRETLDILYRGKSIADVLAMTVEEACDFFENHPVIIRFASCLRDVGLGYIELGQPSTTLSGGEAQRVKLATELGKQNSRLLNTEKTLYILDEPTTGLHFADVKKLLDVLNRLADAGNTLVIIEHNLDVIKCADWIIDLGPEGGEGGGRVVAQGVPEDIIKVKKSYTGQYLKTHLRAANRKAAG